MRLRRRRPPAPSPSRDGGPDLRFSIVVNTWNRRDSVERTLAAIGRLDHDAFEVVVVNGPSTDETEALLASWRRPIRIERCPVACLGTSRNIGLAAAAGDIVAFVDDDALPHPAWLRALETGFADPAVGAVGGPVFDVPLGRIDWQICTCDRLGTPITDSEPPIDRWQVPGAERFMYLAGCNMSFRREALTAIGGFDPDLIYCYDDVDICGRLVDAGHRVGYVDAALVDHDRAASNIRDDQQQLTDVYALLFCRAVYAARNALAGFHDLDEVRVALDRWADEWRDVADDRVARGIMSLDERDHFVARARNGVDEGLAVGSVPRSVPPFAPTDRSAFLPHLPR